MAQLEVEGERQRAGNRGGGIGDVQRDAEEGAHEVAVELGVGLGREDELEGKDADLDHC